MKRKAVSIISFNDYGMEELNQKGITVSTRKKYSIKKSWDKRDRLICFTYLNIPIDERYIRKVWESDDIIKRDSTEEFIFHSYRALYRKDGTQIGGYTHYSKCPRPRICITVEKIETLKARYEDAKKLTIGSDPEFCIYGGDDVVSACNVLSGGTDDEVGTDGCNDTGEIRPCYGNTPDDHIANIRACLEKLNDEIPMEYKADTVGDRLALGCHIHLGSIKKDRPVQDYAMYLDKIIGRRFMELSGRARGGYKALGAIRNKPWGIEYRTLPALAIQNPEIARLVYTLVYRAVRYAMILSPARARELFERKSEEALVYRFLGKEDALKYYEFCAKYSDTKNRSKLQATLLEAWGVRRPVYVTFNKSDRYGKEVKDYIKDTLDKYEKSICFFGISRERGEIFYTNHPVIRSEVFDGENVADGLFDRPMVCVGLPVSLREKMNPKLIKIIEKIGNLMKEGKI